MIAIRLTVPIACWRKGAARELLETEPVPSPATCYGALLSLVGEIDRERHRGARVTAGLFNQPRMSQILRTLWRIKDSKTAQGGGENARPDFQQLLIDSDLVLFLDGQDESAQPTLEARVIEAFERPEGIERFGGWSLGESTHLINDAWLLRDARPPKECRAFLLDDGGDVTLPVWVDHVGSAGTRYATGRLVEIVTAPPRARLPCIPTTEGASTQ